VINSIKSKYKEFPPNLMINILSKTLIKNKPIQKDLISIRKKAIHLVEEVKQLYMFDNAKFTIDLQSFDFNLRKMSLCLYPSLMCGTSSVE